MRRLLALMALSGLFGCGDGKCKDATIFLTLNYEGVAASATQVDVAITVGTTAMTRSVAHAPGTSSGTIEVDFTSYPAAGTAIDVLVTARGSDGAAIGQGHAAATAASGCTAISVDVQGGIASSPDMSGDMTGMTIDMTSHSPDMTGDMSGPGPDMPQFCIVDTDTFDDGCLLSQ